MTKAFFLIPIILLILLDFLIVNKNYAKHLSNRKYLIAMLCIYVACGIGYTVIAFLEVKTIDKILEFICAANFLILSYLLYKNIIRFKLNPGTLEQDKGVCIGLDDNREPALFVPYEDYNRTFHNMTIGQMGTAKVSKQHQQSIKEEDSIWKLSQKCFLKSKEILLKS